MLQEAMIQVRDLSYTYDSGRPGETTALSGVDLEIRRGEFVAIAGPNGSGKSTLARHFNALLLPTRGQVLVDGLDTALPENLWEIRRRVGMVFQNPDNQIDSTLIEEDVTFGPENPGLPPPHVRERVEDALVLAGRSRIRQTARHLLTGG